MSNMTCIFQPAHSLYGWHRRTAAPPRQFYSRHFIHAAGSATYSNARVRVRMWCMSYCFSFFSFLFFLWNTHSSADIAACSQSFIQLRDASWNIVIAIAQPADFIPSFIVYCQSIVLFPFVNPTSATHVAPREFDNTNFSTINEFVVIRILLVINVLNLFVCLCVWTYLCCDFYFRINFTTFPMRCRQQKHQQNE